MVGRVPGSENNQMRKFAHAHAQQDMENKVKTIFKGNNQIRNKFPFTCTIFSWDSL